MIIPIPHPSISAIIRIAQVIQCESICGIAPTTLAIRSLVSVAISEIRSSSDSEIDQESFNAACNHFVDRISLIVDEETTRIREQFQ